MPPRLTVRTVLRDYWVILLAPLLLLGPALARGQALFWGTPALQFVAWWTFAWDSLRQGVLPLWNPLNGMGAPLLANYQLAFFYPPNWLLLAFAGLAGKEHAAAAVAWGYTFLAILHLAWGGLGMAVLLRRLGFPWLAQVVGGLAFGLSGYVVARLGFFSMVWVAAWLPWVIYFTDHLASLGWPVEDVPKTGFHLIPPLAACVAMQLLAGHAQLTWYGLLLAGAWVTAGVLREYGLRSGVFKRLGWAWLSLAAATALAAGIAAVQLVPTFEFLQISQRAEAYAEDAMTYSFWPWRLVTLFSPDFFGSPAQGDYWGYASYWEDHLYAGLLPLLLALASLWILVRGILRDWRSRGKGTAAAKDRRRGLTVFAWLLVVVAFLLALGKNTPIFPFLYEHVPTFSMFQAPARYLVWAAFAIPLLAGVSIEHWRCPTGKGLYWFRLGTAGAFAITLGAGLASIFLRDVRLTFIRATALTGLWAMGFGLLTLALPYAEKRGWLAPWRWAVIAWTLADLLVAGWSLNPVVGPEFYSGSTPTLEQARAAASGGRVYLSRREEYDLKFQRFLRFEDFRPLEDWKNLRSALIPDLNLLDGIPSANNFDPLLVKDYAAWMTQIDSLSSAARQGWLALMDVGAVEHIDARQPGGVRFDPLPGAARTHWYNCKRSGTAWDVVQEEMSGPPEVNRAVVLDDFQYDALEDSRERCTGDGTADIRWITDLPDQTALEVDAPNEGWLVIADTWYPGWQASIDGKAVILYKADGLFRAVAVGPGKHQVKINYRPAGFYFGGLFSILMLLYEGYLLTKRGRKSVDDRPLQ